MRFQMTSLAPRVLLLATGGTIAGQAASATDNVGYTAGQRTAAELVAAVPALADVPLALEQVAQRDSKDMDADVWWALSRSIRRAEKDASVCGVVVTHGTDTLEETAYWLHRTVAADKPVVLTAAMRPASSLQADGPQNLLDAVCLAQHAQARGVMAVLGGTVWAGAELRKVHNYRLEAFTAGDAGPVAQCVEGRVQTFRAWPQAQRLGPVLEGRLEAALDAPPDWPRVDIVTSHAGADGRVVRALVQSGVQGLVVAATGNGTLHQALESALQEAVAAGVRVVRSTRCVLGSLVPDGGALPQAGGLTPAQARVALMLELMGA
jgi:L-asparaginase